MPWCTYRAKRIRFFWPCNPWATWQNRPFFEKFSSFQPSWTFWACFLRIFSEIWWFDFEFHGFPIRKLELVWDRDRMGDAFDFRNDRGRYCTSGRKLEIGGEKSSKKSQDFQMDFENNLILYLFISPSKLWPLTYHVLGVQNSSFNPI